MYSTYELIVQRKLESGRSLKDAISEASAENPSAHSVFIQRENSPNRKGLRLFNQSKYKTFAEAVQKISESESISLAKATRAAAVRFPKLHMDFVNSLKGAKK